MTDEVQNTPSEAPAPTRPVRAKRGKPGPKKGFRRRERLAAMGLIDPPVSQPSAPEPVAIPEVVRSRSSENAGDVARTVEVRRRRPMAIPRRKLELPPIPGYHVHIINDTPGRILAAQQGGYEFVTPDEVQMNEFAPLEGRDLGNRVSYIVGTDQAGQPLRAYAMKIRQEWYDEDQKIIQEITERGEKDIRRGRQQAQVDLRDRSDQGKTYVKEFDFNTTFAKRRS